MKVYDGIWKYMRVCVGIRGYMWIYGGMCGCAGCAGGGGRINAFRTLPPGKYANARTSGLRVLVIVWGQL